jgi:hypothetical protein
MTYAMRILVLLALLPGAALATPPAKGPAPGGPPKKHSPPACGAKVLPLVEGNSWSYVAVAAPGPMLPELQKLAPPAPKTIDITVKKLETKGQETVASLEEKIHYDIKNPANDKKPITYDVTVQSTITCSKTKFEISPESFFFAGEAGGYRELAFDKFDRSRDTSLKLTPQGTIGDAQWREDIVAHFTRSPTKSSNAKMSGGKLELERSFTPEPNEAVATNSGNKWYGVEKLALVTTGRITFDEPKSENFKSELPANWVTKFWFVGDIGIVQTLNMYQHMFQLDHFTLN